MDVLIPDRDVFAVTGISIASRKGDYGVRLDVEFEIQLLEFVSAGGNSISGNYRPTESNPITVFIQDVENHTLQSLIQWYGKAPEHRRISFGKNPSS